MSVVLRREAAERDLIAQWVWYAENASIEVADRFLIAAEATLAFLAKQPDCGAPIAVTKKRLIGIRRFPVSGGFERILIFYFPLQNGIDVVRVVHGSRDLDRLFR